MSRLSSLRGTACASMRFESPTMISWIKARSRALLCMCTSFLVLFAAGAPAHATNNAAFVSQSVPTAMIAGSVYRVNVMLSNNGTTTWTTAGSYALGSQNPENGSTWGVNRVALPSSIAPGGLASFSFQVTAPSTPGTYNFQWRVVQDGVEWFGPYTPNVAVTVSAPTPGNAAQVVGTSVQATMAQGQSYPIAVTMRNTGTTTWPAGATYRLGSTNPQNTMLWGVNRVNLASAVAPGQQYTFSFNVVAPAAGSYTMGWGMVQENVQWFGGTSSSAVTVTAPSTDMVTYIHTDGLGSPVARTDAAGSLVSKTRYEPYGLTAAGAMPTIGFTGHVNDADTGLVYMQQRYYDPSAGRMLSIDPVVTDANTGGSFNRYAYANNSPYRYIDSDGRDARDEQIAGQLQKERERCGAYCPGGVVAAGSVAVGGARGPRSAAAAAIATAVVAGITNLANTNSQGSDNEDSQKIYLTYTKEGPMGEFYIGRASGYGTAEQVLAKRDRFHHMNFLGYGKAKLDKSLRGEDGYAATRGREQMGIDAHGGTGSPFVGNSINGISYFNPYGDYYMLMAYKYFGDWH